jgi:hypothetical protein
VELCDNVAVGISDGFTPAAAPYGLRALARNLLFLAAIASQIEKQTGVTALDYVPENPNTPSIFLHVTDGTPTWGCVAIGRSEMKSLLTWLDPSANPRITIGVGDPALLPAQS